MRHVEAEKPLNSQNESIPVDVIEEMNKNLHQTQFELLSSNMNLQHTIEQSMEQHQNNEWNKLTYSINENIKNNDNNNNNISKYTSNGFERNQTIEEYQQQQLEQELTTTSSSSTKELINSNENNVNDEMNENGDATDYVKIPVQELISTFEKQTRLIINQKVNLKLIQDNNEAYKNLSNDYQNQCQIKEKEFSIELQEPPVKTTPTPSNGQSSYQTFKEYERERDKLTSNEFEQINETNDLPVDEINNNNFIKSFDPIIDDKIEQNNEGKLKSIKQFTSFM